MQKTLIVYGTRRGTTADTAQVIGETLVLKCHHKVDMTDARHVKKFRKKLAEYNNIIVGSSIVSGRWVGQALRSLKKNAFTGQKIAVFVTAGGTINKSLKEGIPREVMVNEAIQKYIDVYLPKFKFVPVAKTAFGGNVERKGIMKYNNWNRDEIELWTVNLGNLIEKPQLIQV